MHPRESDLVLQGNRDGLQTSEDQAVSERVQKVSGVIEEDIKTEFVVGMILVSNVITSTFFCLIRAYCNG